MGHACLALGSSLRGGPLLEVTRSEEARGANEASACRAVLRALAAAATTREEEGTRTSWCPRRKCAIYPRNVIRAPLGGASSGGGDSSGVSISSCGHP
ncbi:hypothetical protein HPB50_014611 [Hyalomma asiaticum]|uniref:Uncharacterized protein n=1 Tax=Hyalomma asiaticum TaxID=266040 RepID=A0ACB7TGN4_HYAAI|nr:hypothetical protein HPB50_014611 [Hyalomma asiaticum]